MDKDINHAATDIKTKVITATEIRDNLDVWCQSSGTIYSSFLEKSIPVLLNILDGPPVFDSTSHTQARSIHCKTVGWTNTLVATSTMRARNTASAAYKPRADRITGSESCRQVDGVDQD